MKVYLAASTAELHRARWAVEALAAAGIDVIAGWLDNVERVGVANPTDAPRADRVEWSLACFRELQSADVLWFLVPPSSAATRGAWWEFGAAYVLDKRVVSSGTTRQSIFCALGDEYATDADALVALAAIAQEHAA